MRWLANGSPPWAAYLVFMLDLLIALDKHPGVRPVGVGETCRRIFAKIVLEVTAPEAIMECQYDQLRAGLKAGIHGAVHRVQAMQDGKSTTEDWVLFLVDTNNAFNEINLVRILWTARHLWPFVAHFVFSCCRHCSSPVLRNRDGTDSFLHSKEGMTQWGPSSNERV